MTECVCGTCTPCRRELRLTARTVAQPVVLSPLARQILAEPIGYEPVARRVSSVQNRKARPFVSRAKPAPERTTCAKCGQLRGIITRNRGNYVSYVLSGADDYCEVCAERPRYQTALDAYNNAPPETRRSLRRAASRARHYLARETRNGRAYSLITTTHGNTTGYDAYGCRCTHCTTWKANDNEARRATAV